MKIRIHKKQFLVLTAIVLLIAIVLTIFQLQRQQIIRQQAWNIDTAASSLCGNNGTVLLDIAFTNTEPPGDTSFTMHVTAHDLQSDKTIDLGDIAPGETNVAKIDTGLTSVDSGIVEFELAWTDGHGTPDTRQATYQALQACSLPPIPACVVTEASCEWDSAADATTYSVTVTDHGTGKVIKTIDVPADTTRLVFPATPGAQYDCSVVTQNDCGASDTVKGTGDVCPLPTPTPTQLPSLTPSPTPTDVPTPTTTPQPTATPVPTNTPIPTPTPIPMTPTPRPTIQLYPTAPQISLPPPVIVYRTVGGSTQQTIIQQPPYQPAQPGTIQHPASPQPTGLQPTGRPNIPPTGDMGNTILILAGTIATTVIGGLAMLLF